MRNLLVCLAVLLTPMLAQADRLRVTSYDMDDVGGSVRLESDAALGEPWLRIDGRSIKIWFPHIQDVAKFDHERSATDPIHGMALRSGASETALLRVELGNNHHIGREDISITRDGLQALVKLRVPSAQPALVQAAAPAAAAPVAAPAPLPAAAVPAPAAPVAVPAVPAAPAAQPEAANPGIGTAGEKSEDDELGTLEEEQAEHANPMWLLMGASVLLAFVYFGLQRLQKQRLINSPQIEIVGTRKLGHKQELLIVRALGSDHLLLCTNGRSERVASMPSGTEGALALPANASTPSVRPPPSAAASSAPPSKPSQAGGLGLMSRLSSQHRLRKLLDSVGPDAPEAESGDVLDDDFGNELQAATRKRGGALLQSVPAPAARQSDSVAGITRLRQRR